MFKLSSILMLVACVAPAMASDPELSCNRDLRGYEIKGVLPKKAMFKPDLHWCRKACMEAGEECEAYTFVGNLPRDKRVCKIFKLTGMENFFLNKIEPATQGIVSYIRCNDAAQSKCNVREHNVELSGGEPLEPPFAIKDYFWCKKRCMMNSACNAFNFGPSRMCTLLEVSPGNIVRTSKRGVNSLVICNRYGVMPVCGVKNGPLCINTGGPQCNMGLRESHENKCVCGDMWEPCCDGGCDGESMTCNLDSWGKFGQCVPCGGDSTNDYQTCCDGNTCNQEDKRRVCQVNSGQCAPCGTEHAPLCADEPYCEKGLKPDDHNRQCVSEIPVW